MNRSMNKQLKLSVLPVSPAHLGMGWRYPGADADNVMNYSFYRDIARKAEQGKIDMLFLADKYILSSRPDDIDFGRSIHTWPEPITLLSSLIGATDRIGLSATISTTFHEPFHIARTFASMDHLSGGRASWNVVTSRGNAESINFGRSYRSAMEERYEQSDEFLHIVKALWDSWEDDACNEDRSTGYHSDGSKVHPINFDGKFHQVKGPLNVSRPPQGHPVLIMAGESESFKERAAKDADVVFTSLKSLEEAQHFYKDIKSRVARYGRTPNDLLIMPGLHLIIGRTANEVKEKEALWNETISSYIRMDLVSSAIGIDVSECSPDDALPAIESLHEPVSEKYRQVKAAADREGWKTFRQAYSALKKRTGHFSIKGTPETISAELEIWLRTEAADGFTFIPQHMPGGLNDLVDLLIPELQERGLFRTDYEGETLRDHLGLARPSRR